MIRFILLICLTTIITCTSSKGTIEKLESNNQCDECSIYIHQKLIPQLQSCGTQLDSHKDCKFDRDEFYLYGSCLHGMKKEILEELLGENRSFFYTVKDRAQEGYLFTLNYYLNDRLTGITNFDYFRANNSNIDCLGCDLMYKKISNEERLKRMSFEEFHERFKGCFYAKTSDFLATKLNLEKKINEGTYQHSYNKHILLGRDTHYLNFLFYADNKMVDISPVDSIVNRVIN